MHGVAYVCHGHSDFPCLWITSAPAEKGREWVFYDVGGARGQRGMCDTYHSWYAFDIN